MLSMLISPITSLVNTYLTGKVENKKAENNLKLEVTKAKTAIASKVASGEMEWNQSMAEASSNSWKDEYLTILVSIPLVLAFIGYDDVVTSGFAALEACPDYYKTALGVVFAASFGVQKLTKMFDKKNGK